MKKILPDQIVVLLAKTRCRISDTVHNPPT